MLQRAQRIRSQENLVLPLYEPLAKNADEGDFRVPFFSVLAALAVACNDTMSEKLTFITQLFDVDDSKVGDVLNGSAFLEYLFECWHTSLKSLHLIDVVLYATSEFRPPGHLQ